MTGTQAATSSGWIIRYLFDFARAFLERCEFHHEVERSSSGEEEEEAEKRKIDRESPRVVDLQEQTMCFQSADIPPRREE